MKKIEVLVLAALNIFSNKVEAITGFDHWDTLLNTPDLIIAQPEFAKIFGMEGLFNACATDKQFRSIRPVYYGPINKDTSCCQPALQQVTMERIFTHNVCFEKSENQECRSFEKVSETYPISFFINVFERNRKGEDFFLFAKKYTLPRCRFQED